MRYTKSDKQESRDLLLEVLKPGDTIHCILRSVSRSGMSRRIDFFKLTENGELYLTPRIAKVLDMPFDYNKRGLRVDGCGMDMGFATVYELSHALFHGNFNCIGDKCPSAD